jgi:hypothetical protein
MYKTYNFAIRKNSIALGCIGESGIHLHMHWLNPLLFRHKSS